MLGYSPLSTDSRQPYLAPIAPRVVSKGTLPLNIKPLPARIGPDEIAYLDKKGALTIPAPDLRNELLRAYVEFVHPYMPLLDLHEFLLVLDRPDGSLGKLSLILYQAVMFAGSAFADMDHLRRAGYLNRKEARKDFFQKTRLLYDFDYESDRVSLVQALLLLTYYYETPDDQKDTWHWMGVATSVAHTIGLHRNPDKSNMDLKRTRLWKRIWWSTYMRDRLIALGMRRPTRIKSEDFDVPMMDLDDFDIAPLPEGVTCIPADCVIARDTDKQRQLAIMCIQKAKLCLCISHVLSKQYCVLNNNQGMHHDRTTMMLLPKKLDPQKCEVKACDDELQRWLDELPQEARYENMPTDNASINLHKALLHMVFYTTLSALHRPQVLPSAPAPNTAESGVELLDMSRSNVRRAASAITGIAQTLDSLDLVKYLPTTGVTVLLPAIIIHLLDIKAPEEETRRSSLRGFCQCMQVMGKLRDLYAAADYSTAFLEAAIRKAGIHIAPVAAAAPVVASAAAPAVPASAASVASVSTTTTNKAVATDGHQMATSMTPPPDLETLDDVHGAHQNVSDDEVARRLETFLASTPPPSDHQLDGSDASQADVHDQLDRETVATSLSSLDEDMVAAAAGFATALPAPQPSWTNVGLGGVECGVEGMGNAGMGVECDEGDFDSLLNLDAMGDVSAFAFNDFGEGGSGAGQHGEFGGVDVDWMKTMDAIDAVV
ncbi:hypothetical protein K490DRAFT_38524 [Saccharata proteae CBS 121410]|uniref:Xylanolytic transcriptional activator regulatory domain-containing protein n=1 Tax=Saccharata proteae CBS 121410 TaxID=1314787 RepID=A0A6A5YDJ3_9PEZI|nr:hypothetical protein K490DRAFT_38524 [Saccharata proteae CBS 121410]